MKKFIINGLALVGFVPTFAAVYITQNGAIGLVYVEICLLAVKIND